MDVSTLHQRPVENHLTHQWWISEVWALHFQAYKPADVKSWLAYAKNFIWSIDSEDFTIKWFISADCHYSKQ